MFNVLHDIFCCDRMWILFFMFDSKQQTLYILLQSAQTVSQLNGLTGVPAHTTHLETVYRSGTEHLNVVKR